MTGVRARVDRLTRELLHPRRWHLRRIPRLVRVAVDDHVVGLVGRVAHLVQHPFAVHVVQRYDRAVLATRIHRPAEHPHRRVLILRHVAAPPARHIPQRGHRLRRTLIAGAQPQRVQPRPPLHRGPGLPRARHRREGRRHPDQRDPPLRRLQVPRSAGPPQVLAGPRMHQPPLVHQPVGEPHSLDAVVGGVVVGVVEEVESHVDQVPQRLRRADLVVTAVLRRRPARELLQPEHRLLQVHERRVGPANDVGELVEPRVPRMIERRRPPVHDHVSHRCQGPAGVGLDGRARLRVGVSAAPAGRAWPRRRGEGSGRRSGSAGGAWGPPWGGTCCEPC